MFLLKINLSLSESKVTERKRDRERSPLHWPLPRGEARSFFFGLSHRCVNLDLPPLHFQVKRRELYQKHSSQDQNKHSHEMPSLQREDWYAKPPSWFHMHLILEHSSCAIADWNTCDLFKTGKNTLMSPLSRLIGILWNKYNAAITDKKKDKQLARTGLSRFSASGSLVWVGTMIMMGVLRPLNAALSRVL